MEQLSIQISGRRREVEKDVKYVSIAGTFVLH